MKVKSRKRKSVRQLLMPVVLLWAVLCISAGIVAVATALKDEEVIEGLTVTTDVDSTFEDGAVIVKITGSGGCNSSSATATITLTNTSGKDAELIFNVNMESCYSVRIGVDTIKNDGQQKVTLEAGTSVVITMTTDKNSTENKLTLSGFSLAEVKDSAKITVIYDDSLGSVTAGGTAVANNDVVEIAQATDFVATAKSGSSFLGWVDPEEKLLASGTTYGMQVTGDKTIRAVFVKTASDTAYFNNGTYLSSNWNKVASDGGTVVLANNGLLAAGDYTILSGTTFLVPFDDAHTVYTTAPEYITSYTTPSQYRKLTMSSGASITVESGAYISVGAKLSAASGGDNAKAATSGKYGWIHMESGSSITVNGTLSSYGYITGVGEITVNPSGAVHEVFEVRESRGGKGFAGMNNNSQKVFLVSQYYIQNIEAPMTIHSGASLTGHGALNMSLGVQALKVAIIGESNSLFKLNSGTLKKTYLPDKDRSQYDLNGEVDISNVNLSVSGYDFNSDKYILPINGNMDINLLDKTVANITNDLEFLPGLKMTIEEAAELVIASGRSVYVYDSAQWGKYVFSNRRIAPALYSPTRTYTRGDNATDLADVVVDVNGKINVQGNLYTTVDGANITSSNGTGIIAFNDEPDTKKTNIYQATTQTAGTFTATIDYEEVPVVSAMLKNADGTYVKTANGGVDTYKYAEGRWICTVHHHAGDVVQENVVHSTCTQNGGYDNVTYCTVCKTEMSRIQEVIPTVNHETEDCTCVAKIVTDGASSYYQTLQAAVKAYNDGYIQMIKSSAEETVSIDRDVYLDLHGYSVNGTVTVAEGKTLYGLDKTTDGYGVVPEGMDSAPEPGSITVVGTVAAAADHPGYGGELYVAYTADTGEAKAYTFNRASIYVSDYYVEARADDLTEREKGEAAHYGAVGFGATFRGNADAAAALTDIGFEIMTGDSTAGEEVWAEWGQSKPAEIADRYKIYCTAEVSEYGDYSAYGLMEFGTGKSAVTAKGGKTAQGFNFTTVLQKYYATLKPDDADHAKQIAVLEKFADKANIQLTAE